MAFPSFPCRLLAADSMRAAVILVLMLLLPGAVRAQSAPATVAGPVLLKDVYVISNTTVDEQADTVAAARENALVTARRAAFNRLMRRIVPPQDRVRTPFPSDDELVDMVSSFEVADEKSSSKRYLANLTLRFNAKNVRDFLRGVNISGTELIAKPVLLLAVYEDAAGRFLWEPVNPWRDALALAIAASGSNGDRLLSIALPQGDAQDAAVISADQAIGGDAQRLSQLRQRYGVADILLLHARASASGGNAVDIIFRRLGTAGEDMRIERFETMPGEPASQTLNRGALQIVQGLQDEWLQQSALELAQAGLLDVQLPLTSLNDWLAMQQRLSEIPAIRSIEIAEISTTRARVKLHYIGAVEKLAAALSERQLALVQEADHWQLRPYSP